MLRTTLPPFFVIVVVAAFVVVLVLSTTFVKAAVVVCPVSGVIFPTSAAAAVALLVASLSDTIITVFVRVVYLSALRTCRRLRLRGHEINRGSSQSAHSARPGLHCFARALWAGLGKV